MTDTTTSEITDPELSIDTPPDAENRFTDPATPLNTRIRLERWVDDYAQEVGSIQFDARLVFDAQPLSTVKNDLSDLDWVFYDAESATLIDAHDGPFTVEAPEDLAEYIAERVAAGHAQASHRAKVALSNRAIASLAAKIAEQTAQLNAARAAAGIEVTVTKTASDIVAGDVLVKGLNRVTVDFVRASRTVPGLLVFETDFGSLYIARYRELQVEAH